VTVSDRGRDGAIDYLIERFLEYDADGSLTKSTDLSEETKDGKISKTILTFTYDANGNPLRLERDLDGDGTVDSIRISLYDQPECWLIDLEDNNNDGVFDHKYNPCTGGEIY